MGCLKIPYQEKNERSCLRIAYSSLRKNEEKGSNYYPFGLTMAGISSKAAGGTENKKGYNGNELQNKEFSDGSGLDAYDFNARTYDQQIGRFLQVDPLPEDGDQESFTPYQFGLDNPVRYDDPDGKCPLCGLIGAGVGALVGGAIEAGTQLYQHGEVNDWGAVGGATLQGAITGGVAGLTGGASLAVNVGASASANVIGGAVNNAIQGKEITVKSVVTDAAVGAAAGLGGKLLDKAIGAANKTESVVRVMSKAELQATKETGLVRGGREGTHYATTAASNDAKRVTQRLALPVKPEVKVTLKVPKGAFSQATKVNPAYGMPGGGLERKAVGQISAEVEKVKVLKNGN